MSTQSPNLRQILSDTWRIITAHPRHFSALSALFLLPVSFAAMLYPFITQPAVHSHYLQSLFTISTPPGPKPQLITSLIYFLASLLFSLCSTSSITYSAFAAFYKKPVEFIPSLNSILVSFFPLLITQIVSGLIIFVFVFILLVLAIPAGLVMFEYNKDHVPFVFFVGITIVVIAVMYLQVEWGLSTSVVILESKWGLAPLKRSSYLVKGTRRVVLSMRALFSSAGGILSMWYLNVAANRGGASEGWFCVEMVVYVVLATVLSLFGIVANTVLFVYCKASRGDSVADVIDVETGVEYVALPKA
ncbi:hypothetical protein CASFOL_003954 [Castilleja foliolosa]|uniref:Transmembrane protein n=1 Tax=Castilleja foliolosa TaxID=1961234 RepID=A0ABD3EJ01_9LAMI